MLAVVFSKVLIISIMAAVLIVLILLVKAIFKEKLSARWHYYIWFLLAARLVIPYTPELSLDWQGIFPQEEAVTRNQSENEAAINMENVFNYVLKTNEEERIPEHKTVHSLTNTNQNHKPPNSIMEKSMNNKLKLMFLEAASKVWIIGIIFFTLYIIIINFIMNYKIRATSVSVENSNVQNILEDCKKLVKVKGDIPVVYQKHIRTPAVYGIFSTKMLMPADMIDQLGIDEIRYIILHELCHFKRRDTITGMLQMLLCVLHWFNPLIWYASNKMKEDREPVCDEAVLSYIRPSERRSYAETLIKFLKYFSENHWIHSTANMGQGSVTNMEWRLKLMKILKRRSILLGIIIALATITLGIAGVLIINKHISFSYFANAADVNTTPNTNKELPMRGKILDRNGKGLAVSIPADTISINPREIQDSGQDTEVIAKTLAEILDLHKEKVMKQVSAPSRYEIVKKRVDKETGNKIRDWKKNNSIKGIYVDEDYKRYYPNNSLAAHVIGFTGIDLSGLGGVEASMEQYLKLKGTNVSVEGEKTLESGMNVVLTIDARIQSITENALDKAIIDYKTMNGAAAIIMDPKNGEILAMASKPDFNSNMPFIQKSRTEFQTPEGMNEGDIKVLSGTVWKNKAITDTFEPGSTFKAITSAAGIEEGIITPETLVDDTTVSVAGWKINCWNPNAHGKETFKEAVYNSCNPAFVRVAQNLGIEKFYSYVRKFGFYDKTGLELLGEADSLLHKNPAEIDMAVASFGQRLQVTPIQVVSAYGAIANGGKLMKPQIIKEIVDTKGGSVKTLEPQVVRNVISPKTAETVREMLEGVVSKGTGANAFVEGYKIAGKTGTSEKINGKYMASFAGFAPADNPKIVCYIILDEPMADPHTGGMTAAPVAGKVMKEVLDYMSNK